MAVGQCPENGREQHPLEDLVGCHAAAGGMNAVCVIIDGWEMSFCIIK